MKSKYTTIRDKELKALEERLDKVLEMNQALADKFEKLEKRLEALVYQVEENKDELKEIELDRDFGVDRIGGRHN